MKIVVLDGKTLTQDELNWDSFSQYGDMTLYERTPYEENEIVKRIGDAEAVLTNKVPITDAVMERCPALSYIGVTATGYNIVDVKAAVKRKITVTNVPGYATDAVAELVFALLFHITRQIAACTESVHRGDWCRCEDFTYLPAPQMSLSGKVMGIIGYGQTGRKTAEIAGVFGMKVLVYTRHPKKEEETEMLQFVSMEDVLRQSDVVSLHCPLTEETRFLIDENALNCMKKDAILINTSRGPLVDEEALSRVLKEKRIRAAGLDVLCEEPMRKNHPLLGLSNCVITPHIAWATKECREHLMDMVEKNLEAFLHGEPQNVVVE